MIAQPVENENEAEDVQSPIEKNVETPSIIKNEIDPFVVFVICSNRRYKIHQFHRRTNYLCMKADRIGEIMLESVSFDKTFKSVSMAFNCCQIKCICNSIIDNYHFTSIAYN